MEEGKHDQLVVKEDWKGVTMPQEDIQRKSKPASKIGQEKEPEWMKVSKRLRIFLKEGGY